MVLQKLKHFFLNIFNGNWDRHCIKCKIIIPRNKISNKCQACRDYIYKIKLKQEEEIKLKEDLTRRNWIRLRDEFLKLEDGSR